MSFCPHCKKTVKKRASFCKHCGLKIPHDSFDFEDETGNPLVIDSDLVREIMNMRESGEAEYDIEFIGNRIDLHLDETKLSFGIPILQIQTEIAEKAIDSCIANGYSEIIFITGRGEWKLYDRVSQMLKDHKQIGEINNSTDKIQAFFKS